MPASAVRQINRLGLLALAPVLLALAGESPAGARTATAAAKTTIFSGSIVSGTGSYRHARGAVRVVLHGSSTTTGRTFKLTFSGPSCASQTLRAPSRCVSLTGTATGKVAQAPVIPDIGAQYALSGSGRVKPLGGVRVTGTTHGLGFIARGRYPLSVTLRNSAGGVTITAAGPLTTGSSSPF
jgi:hypothetical protein